VQVMRGTGVDHLDLVVSDLERSLNFYRQLLEPLGYVRTSEIAGERGERVVYLGGQGMVSMSLRQAQTPGQSDRYRVGIHHLAFEAPSRDIVDACAGYGSEASRSRTTRRSTTTAPGTTPGSSTTPTASNSRSCMFRSVGGRAT
jgi:hypothetical protein